MMMIFIALTITALAFLATAVIHFTVHNEARISIPEYLFKRGEEE